MSRKQRRDHKAEVPAHCRYCGAVSLIGCGHFQRCLHCGDLVLPVWPHRGRHGPINLYLRHLRRWHARSKA